MPTTELQLRSLMRVCTYIAEVSLPGAPMREAVAMYSMQATGDKFLIKPRG